MNKIKFDVIGCGHIGKRHGSMIVDNDNIELVALCDIKSRDSLGLELFDIIPFCNEIDDLLNYKL